jgi:hypothetical protein
MRVDRIGVEVVDRYARAKAAELAAAQQRIARLTEQLAEAKPKGRATAALSDQLRAAKASPGLSNASINKSLDVLS